VNLRNHGEAAVLELAELHLLEAGLVLGDVQGVELDTTINDTETEGVSG
jgi:hypothetical protein